MPARKPPKEITRWTNQKDSGRSRGVTLIAVHESVGMTNAWDLILFCERHEVSYHDAVDLVQLVHTVQFSDTAWHLRNGNPSAVGLCLTSPVRAYTRVEWLGPQLAKVEYAAWWVARACKIYGLPLRHCNYTQIRSALRGNKSEGGVITHDDYTQATGDGTHTDPRNFPMDVCLDMARKVTDNSGDDMAQVPQNEWDAVRDNVDRMANGNDTEQTASRADAGYVPTLVWSRTIPNYKGESVEASKVLTAIEGEIMQLRADLTNALAKIYERLPSPPAS